MKRLSLIFTVAVFAFLAFGLLSRHRSVASPDIPVFLQVPTVQFEPLPHPGGEETLSLWVVGPGDVALAEAVVQFRAGQAPFWGFTDAQGRVRFEGLPAQELEVVVMSFGRPILRTTLSPSKHEQRVTLGPPTPPPAYLPEIERSPLAGTMRGTRNPDRTGYAVVLLPVGPPQALAGAVPRRALTTRDGKFSIEDLAHGTYRLAVSPPWAVGGSWPDLAPEGLAEFEHTSDASQPILELRLGTIAGVVLDDVDRPLEDALVVAVEDGHPNRVWAPLVSDSKGHFEIQDMPAAVYRLTVTAGEGEVTALVRVQAGLTVQVKLPPLRPRDRSSDQ